MNTIDKIIDILAGQLPNDVKSLRLQFLSGDRNYLQGTDKDNNVVWVIPVRITRDNHNNIVFEFSYMDYDYYIGEIAERKSSPYSMMAGK